MATRLFCFILLVFVIFESFQNFGTVASEIDSQPNTNQPVSLDTKLIYVLEGTSVNIVAKAGEGRAIQFCRWDAVNNSKVGTSGLIFVNEDDDVPGLSVMKMQQPEEKSSEVKGYNSFGAGLSNGECGITIQNITQEDITTWKYLLIEFSKTDGDPVAVTRDIRLEPAIEPTKPQIENKELLKKISESWTNENPLAISCCSQNGVPAPQLQFMLDESKLPIVSEQLQDGNSTKQCISTEVNLNRRDNGKRLKCVLEHLTFSGQAEDLADVEVTFVPEVVSALTYPGNGTIEIQLPAEESSVTIRFTGNPQPIISWELQNPVSQSFEPVLPKQFSVRTLSNTEEMFEWDSILSFTPDGSLNSSKSYTFKIVATNEVGSVEIFVVANQIFTPTIIHIQEAFNLTWVLIPLITALILIILVIIFLILARANGWACWRQHVAVYYTQEKGKDLVYNPVMTTTDYA